MARISNDLFDDNMIMVFNDNKIYTVRDFLDVDIEKIVSIANLSYKDVVAARKSILQKYSATSINGKDYYRNYVKNTAIVPTGIPSLDKLLEGGMLTGNILEICGFSCAGKSQFCHTISVNVAHELGLQVLYVDSKKNFSVNRLKSIIENKFDKNKMDKILEKIQVCETRDIHECITMLHDLSKNIPKSLRVIIVDSLPALFLPMLGDKKLSNCLLNDLVNITNYIATKYHIVFIVINLITRWMENENVEEAFSSKSCKQIINPVLGKYWQTVPSTRLLFQMNQDEPGSIKVSVMKTSTQKTGAECTIHLNENGLY